MGGTDCGEYRVGLGVYAIGRLAGDEAAVLREHLAGCGGCRAELDELRAVADLLTRTMAPADGEAAAAPRTERGAGRRARTRPSGASSRLLNGACAASRPPGR
ncbi:zf-HC2 domain-containing protein [Actinomadura rugatobispora]|uniref:Zf-HC2 domain-containing protein n=1 Tax=Actinomadura rugatobispora TaxID=1994 RepID=A0ABW1A2K7_9ACTN